MELRPLQHRPWGLGLTVRGPCSGPSRQKRMGAHHREQEGPALPSRQQELPEPAFSDDVTVQACVTSQQSAEFHCPHCRPGGVTAKVELCSPQHRSSRHSLTLGQLWAASTGN
ncbi:uncharacterized protein LOC144579329 [Callithrix jacchus]